MIVFILFATMNLDFELIGDTRAKPFRLIESTTPVSTVQSQSSATVIATQLTTAKTSSLPTFAPYSTRRAIRNQRHQRTRISRCQNGRCTP